MKNTTVEFSIRKNPNEMKPLSHLFRFRFIAILYIQNHKPYIIFQFYTFTSTVCVYYINASNHNSNEILSVLIHREREEKKLFDSI